MSATFAAAAAGEATPEICQAILSIAQSDTDIGDPGARLVRCAQAIASGLGAAIVTIRDIDPVTRMLRLRASTADPRPESRRAQLLPLGATTLGQAAADRRTIRVDRGTSGGFDELGSTPEFPLATLIGSPLIANGSLIGALGVFFHEAPAASASRTVETLAALVGVAFSNWEAAERAQRLALLLELMPSFATTLAIDGSVSYMNAAARARLGIDPDGAVSSLFNYRPPGWASFLEREIVPALERDGFWRGKTEHVTADGDVFYVAQTSVAHRDAGGTIRAVTNLAHELTGDTDHERRFKAADERTRFALEAARAGTWEHDLKAGRVIWSDTMRTIQGFGTDEAEGTFEGFVSLIHPADRPAMLAAVQQAIESARAFQLKFRVMWPDGSLHWIEAHARVVVDPQTGEAARILGFAQDVTERELLEDRLRKGQRLEAVGQLAGGLAHDFNNLLTVIVGFSGLLTESLAPDDDRRADVAEIHRAGGRAAELTRQLLAFSRQQVLQPVVLNLNALVDDSSRMLSRLAGEHIAMSLNLTAESPKVKADPGQLEQVLVNLVVNARDAMPGGGRLTITTRVDIAAEGCGQPRQVVLVVEDTGTGMDDAVRQRIFEPFFTTKGVGQGTGLGLATVFGIVGQSGGAIDVRSEVGRGTAFTIRLPEVAGEAAEIAPQQKAFPPGNETILLVEDDRAVRSLVTATLKRCGYTTIVADSPARALTLSDEHPGAIDLLLTDVVMPGMLGPELHRQLTLKRPQTTVAFMSGFAHEAIAQHGVLEASVTLIHKPFTASELARRVRAHLDAATSSA